LHALDEELAWGHLDNRPLLALVAYYVEEFATARPADTLDLLRRGAGIRVSGVAAGRKAVAKPEDDNNGDLF